MAPPSLARQAAGTPSAAGTLPLPSGTPCLWLAPNVRTQYSGAPGRQCRRALRCWAAARPFGGTPPEAGGRQAPLPAALAAHAVATDFVPAASVTEQAPPVAEQLSQLRALLPELGRAATYGDKVEVLRAVPAVQAFFSRTREGRLVDKELSDLAPKEAYCLACLPAIHQEHVLSLIPTGVPVTSALAKLAGDLARVEDFYDSIGGLVGYQAQCLELIAQQQPGLQGQQGHTQLSSPTSPSSSDSVSSSSSSLCSTDDAWPPSFTAGPSSSSSTASSPSATPGTDFLVPVGLDLASPSKAAEAAAAVAAGIQALPSMAEIYPLGGAGDRLGLRCDRTGESLPTAVLQYCGRPLLESLVRDLQAREYLYWQLHRRQLTTPVAIMTSAAKGNHWRVAALFEQSGWFGRGSGAFRLFQQPLVPMVAVTDGRWLLQRPLQVMMKPGGHGVIWKLMIDAGVFDWLAGQGREAAIVRQISNPMAGTDNTLLALAGVGFPERRSFGFASCERVVGAAEGMNVLAQERHLLPPQGSHHSATLSSNQYREQEQQQQQHLGEQQYAYSYRITNVEYTEFERLGVTDSSVDEESNTSVFPANTNVLYVGLQAVESRVRASMAAGSTDAVLPGMILNTSKQVSWADPLAGNAERSVAAGRLECTMQNLADCLAQTFPEPLQSGEEKAALDTFLVYNQRRKVTSSAKRRLKPGSTRVHQTPDGSFLDLQRNAHELLSTHCGMEVPEVGSVSDYLRQGPGFVFLAHPALGPLWHVIAQKIRGGSLAPRSELQLEVAEACLQGLQVAGSLRVLADAPMGRTEMVAPPPPAAASTARRASSLLEALLSPGTNSSLNGLNGVEGPFGGGSSSSEEAGGSLGGGYSQPCSADPPPGCEGQPAEARLVYSERCGRVRLHNVRVENAGVEWDHPDNVWWRHSLVRRESCRILLRGMSEFEARDVTLRGDQEFEVPDGHRMLVSAAPDGTLRTLLQPLDGQPTWRWRYSLGPGGEVQLEMEEEEAQGSRA